MSPTPMAASVLLARASTSQELFVVHRAEGLRFFGGFFAFPGGKTLPVDRDLALTGPADALQDRCATAARELFEETGVLIARRPDGSFPASGAVLHYLRRKLVGGEISFAQVLAHLELRVRASDFTPLGRLLTPPFLSIRFDTAFFLALLPPNQDAEVWPGELDSGEWATPAALLERWRRGACLVSPPTVVLLDAVRGRPAAEMADCLVALFRVHAATPIPPIYFAPGVQLIPLATPSLPPTSYTNAYLVGRQPAYLLDPGAVAPDEQDRLFTVLDQQQAAGCRLTAVVLTHHHPDHTGAAVACAGRYRVPILAHRLTAEKLHGKVPVDRAIEAGDRLDLGTAPDGSGAWFLEAVHTPGHAPGHLAFYEPHYRLLFVGDMVSTLSSVVIAPPDGDLALYLASLDRLRAYDCRLLLPAHGTPSPRARQVLDDCISHRRQREEQLLAALRAAPRSVPELARALYKGLPPALLPFAELQVLAGLIKLQREGRAEVSKAGGAEMWSRRSASGGREPPVGAAGG